MINPTSKKVFLGSAALSLLSFQSVAADFAGLDLFGYTRGGFYSSADNAPRGGYTLGGEAQKFRLGNEGDNGLEFGMRKNFDVGGGRQFGVTYMPAVWNGTTSTVEAYGTLSGLPFAPEAVFWGGQRRLRIQDVHIVDRFFQDYGDNFGAGFTGMQIGPIKLGAGIFTGDSIDNKVSNPNQARRININLGDINTNPGGKLDVIITGVTGKFAYGGNGTALSLLHNQTDFLLPGLKNSLFVQAANGHAGLNGQFFGLNNAVAPSYVMGVNNVITQVNNPSIPNPGQSSWRVIQSFNWQLGRVGGQTIASYQHATAQGGPTDGIATVDTSLGGRMSYAFNDYFKIVTEAGITTRSIDGQPNQRLGKLTIAPALALQSDFWSRPELRFYVTHASWNSAAAVANAATFGAGGRTSSTLFGIQLEAWWK